MTKDESIPLEDFQTLLFSYEQLLNNQVANIELTSFALHAQKFNHNNRKPQFSNNKGRVPESQTKNRTKLDSHLIRNSSIPEPLNLKVSPVLINSVTKILIAQLFRFVTKAITRL